MERSADYIVAGAGSAGCVLARRLAQSGATVILLEAGGPDRTRLVRQPGMIAIFHNVPALKKRLDWGYYTAPQASALGRRIPQPRGRVLGGSGSINGMLFVRGNRKNYDDWAAAGCAGWSYADVLPSFKRLEDWEDGASALRGSGGPVKVTGRRTSRRRRPPSSRPSPRPRASRRSTTTTASPRKARRSSSRTPAAGCGTARQSPTWTITACRTWRSPPGRSSPGS